MSGRGQQMPEQGPHVSAEIASQPECWAQARETARQLAGVLPPHGARVALVGCGTSLHVARAAAGAREQAGQGETDAFPASEMPDRRYDAVVAISRSGTTTEVLEALDRVPRGVRTVAITADASAPVTSGVHDVVLLDYADEQSVVQTRFATSTLTVLRAHAGHDLGPVIDQAQAALEASLDERLVDRGHYVFLGRDWATGVAAEAALKVREAASAWSEVYPALEYRHGPVSAATDATAVWLFGAADESLVRDLRPTGAAIVTSVLDPQAELVLAQRVAVATALRRGLDPDQPRYLTRSVVLAEPSAPLTRR